MPKKQSSRPNNGSFVQTTFVQLRLNAEHKDGFVEWMKRKNQEIELDIAAFISNGHKVGITWDDNSACWIVSATCKIEGNVNENHCMTSRSDNWYEALAMNVYKHDVMCKGGSWVDEQEVSNWG